MEIDNKYQIRAERVTTKFGPTVLMHVKETPYEIVKVFIPKRYSSVISDDMEFINSQKASLNLVYKGLCKRDKSYFSHRMNHKLYFNNLLITKNFISGYLFKNNET
jgi:hypothetical protein